MVVICYNCEKEFGYKKALASHCDSLGHSPAHICRICRRIFVDVLALKQHNDAVHNYPCDNCAKTFKTKAKLRSHSESCEVSYHCHECNHCLEGLPNQDALKNHNKNYHEFECWECNQILTSATALGAHDDTQHGHKCQYCDSGFKNQLTHDQHVNSPVHTINCSLCADSFYTETTLERHVIAVHNYKCSHCGKVCSSLQDLEVHNVKEHRLKCDLCTNVFSTVIKLSDHRSLFHIFICSKCSITFSTDALLKGHEERVHTVTYSCERCPAEFRTPGLLQEHDSNVYMLSCPLCEERIPSEASLLAHYKENHTFKCDPCDAHFDSQITFESHVQKTHVYDCDKCEGTFFEIYSAFKSHEYNTHTYLCPQCPERYELGSNLTNHMLSCHTFECKECGGSFGSAEKLGRHFESTHQYNCEKCKDTPFESSSALKRHEDDAHTYLCPECPQRFQVVGGLTKHIIRSHSFRCRECGGNFDSSKFLNLHVKNDHKQTILTECEGPFFASSTAMQSHDENAHAKTCPNFPRKFTAVDLAKHFISSHTMNCENCPDTHFASLEAKTHHEAVTHRQSLSQPISSASNSGLPLKVPCPSCKASFESAVRLKEYQTSALNLSCSQCVGSSFDTLGTLKRHYDTTYHCPLCDTTFETRHTEGIRLHAADCHMSKCTVCSGFFTDQETLRKHIAQRHDSTSSTTTTKIETPEMGHKKDSYLVDVSILDSDASEEFVDAPLSPYQIYCLPTETGTQTQLFDCKQCSAVFEKQSELDVHNRHSPFHGERVTRCIECNLLFPDQIQLLRHIESKPHGTRWVLSMI